MSKLQDEAQAAAAAKAAAAVAKAAEAKAAEAKAAAASEALREAKAWAEAAVAEAAAEAEAEAEAAAVTETEPVALYVRADDYEYDKWGHLELIGTIDGTYAGRRILAAFAENASAVWPDGTAVYVRRIKK